MQNSLQSLCIPRDSAYDAGRRDTVLDLFDLIDGRIDAAQFFSENYVTDGMHTLITQVFARLAGQSSQAIFRLRQAMGGGKTHNMLTVGLLAKHPIHMSDVLAQMRDVTVSDPGMVEVVAFSGRQNDEKYGIWGAIARQLGRFEHFKDNYAPLQAPGQQAWANLLRGRRVLILIDELAPYLDSARAVSVGNSDLSQVTVTAMANLFNALQHADCQHVCLVMGELVGVYDHAAQQLQQVLQTIDAEASRLAQNITPVQLNTNELYQILRKRLFVTLPDEAHIREVAQGYAQALAQAKQMNIAVESPLQFQTTIMDSYPFHPAIRDLYARFRENQGFQQTRGLIRLMRLMVHDLWQSGAADTVQLLGAHLFDFNNPAVLTEVEQINNTLTNAIAHDVASKQTAVAELIDSELGGSDARDVTRLILMASLSTATNPILGLALHEIVAALVAPGRDISQIQNVVRERLLGKAWYLHGSDDGALYFRNVENVTAKLESMVRSFATEQAIEEIKTRLHAMFEPKQAKHCYQRLYVMPAVNEIDVRANDIALVIVQPLHVGPVGVGGLPKAIEDFYAQLQYKNRVMFLTGATTTYQQLIENGKRLRAIRAISDELRAIPAGNNQVQLQQARQLEENIIQHFNSAVRETFTRLVWPVAPQANGASLFAQEFTMKFDGNNYSGEQQIIQLLRDKQKYAEDVTSETFRQKIEARLLTQKQMPWSEVERRAATLTQWQWHAPYALIDFRQRMVREGQWRESGGDIEKGPFPKEKTSVSVRVLNRMADGTVTLEVTPRYGEHVYWEVGGLPTRASSLLVEGTLVTRALQVNFLCVDESGVHETGDVYAWKNEIRVAFTDHTVGNGQRHIEITASPTGRIRYTTDGNDPRQHGAEYTGDVIVLQRPAHGRHVSIKAVAQADGIESAVANHDIYWEDSPFTIDEEKPARYQLRVPLRTSDSNESYTMLTALERCNATSYGVKLTMQAASDAWSELSFGDAVGLKATQIRGILDAVRDHVDAGQVTMQIRKQIRFDLGLDLHRFAEAQRITLTRNEVEQ